MGELLGKLRDAFKEGEAEQASAVVQQALKDGTTPISIVEDLSKILKEIGDKFSEGEMFLLDLMSAAEVAGKAMEVLKPALEKSDKKPEYLGKVIMGTVEGDIHDIGKNIVGAVLLATGFEIIDLGTGVQTEKFIEKIKEIKPNLIGASALLTTTMLKQRELIEALKKEGLRDKVKVMIGGSPCTPEWAEAISADGYAPDAVKAAELAKSLLKGD